MDSPLNCATRSAQGPNQVTLLVFVPGLPFPVVHIGQAVPNELAQMCGGPMQDAADYAAFAPEFPAFVDVVKEFMNVIASDDSIRAPSSSKGTPTLKGI